MAKILAVALLACAAAGCGSNCSADNCTGCCDASGACQSGNTVAACGALGASCAACSGAQTCNILGECTFPAGNGAGNGSGNGAGNGSGSGNGSGNATTSTGTTGFTTSTGTTGFTTSTSTTGFTTSTGGTTSGSAGTTGTGSGNLNGTNSFAVLGAVAITAPVQSATPGLLAFALADAPYDCNNVADGGTNNVRRVFGGAVIANSPSVISPNVYVIPSSGDGGYSASMNWETVSGNVTSTAGLASSGNITINSLTGTRVQGNFSALIDVDGGGSFGISGSFDAPICAH